MSKPNPPKNVRLRDDKGKYIDSDPPLLQVVITNPIAGLKLWLTKLISNEGIDVKLKIHPLTAFLVAGAFAVGGFGLGRITVPAQIVKYLPQLAPAPTPDPWREAAYSGVLRFSTVTQKFYLETAAAEAIPLEVPATVSLTKYTGKRIFATGLLNSKTGVLKVSEAMDLEILPNTPTRIPETTPVPTPESTPTPYL